MGLFRVRGAYKGCSVSMRVASAALASKGIYWGENKSKKRKKQDEKCADRREKERGQWKKGWAKIEKRQGGKEARGKEPFSRRGIVVRMWRIE